MRRILTDQDMEALFRAPSAILYKHSPTRPVCAAALDEVEAFLAAHADVQAYLVDVRAEQPLSQQIATRTGRRQESPQRIVLRSGAAVWSASRDDITAGAILRNFSTA